MYYHKSIQGFRLIMAIAAVLFGAALIVTPFGASADGQKRGNKPPKWRLPVLAQCVEPYQGHTVEPQPPAYLLTMQNQVGTVINYKIDNQFAVITPGIQNVSVFYGSNFDAYVVSEIQRLCQVDSGDTAPCKTLSVEQVDPGPRTDGVHARPFGEAEQIDW